MSLIIDYPGDCCDDILCFFTDDQKEYIKIGAVDSYSLCKAIRLGAYEGLIKSWEGKIKIVTSMGKQSTGKSYMVCIDMY